MLEEELRRPFYEVSVAVDRRLASVARLKRLDGSYLEIWSEMHDVAEQLEIGVLQIQMVSREEAPSRVFFTNENFQTPEFAGENRVEKLIIQEEDCVAESGIVITTQGGKQIVVVANAYPCCIAIRGVTNLDAKFDPEYKLDLYKRMRLSEDVEGTEFATNNKRHLETFH
jgi:hypothetical protein